MFPSRLALFQNGWDLDTMTDKDRVTVAPYGTWQSPITPDLLTRGSISFGELAVVPSSPSTSESLRLAYIENRPAEKGRAAVVVTELRPNAPSSDITQGQHNARSAVHEYGGGALTVSPVDSAILFTDYKPGDYALYRVVVSADGKSPQPERVTPPNAPMRYAQAVRHPHQPHFLLAVQEDHTIDEPSKVINTLVIIDAQKQSVKVVAQGHDFYASPSWSPDGKAVAWLTWDHPEMPFWATELWVAAFDREAVSLGGSQSVEGSQGGTVVQSPVWLDDHSLVFTSDAQSGFSLPYKVAVHADASRGIKVGPIKALLRHNIDADFVKPAWTLNNSTVVPLSSDVLACVLTQGSSASLALLYASTGKLVRISTPYREFKQLRRVSTQQIVAVASDATEPAAIVLFDLSSALSSGAQDVRLNTDAMTVIKQSSDLISSGQIPREYLSSPTEITFPTVLPPTGEPALAHAILFPPRNPHFVAPKAASPPCILRIHGGPTSASSGGELSWETNFWSSRGYSVCFVNYGGSTGYGRDYMLRLNNRWGLVDVQDCVSAVKYLTSTPSSKASNGAALPREEPQQMTRVAREQWRHLEEVYDPANGTVSVTLQRPKTDSTWGWLDLLTFPLAIAASAGLAHSLLASTPVLSAHPALATAGLTAAGLTGYLGLFKSAALSESVFASSTLGLQLETKFGFALPSFLGGHRLPLSTRRSHIPRDRILDVVLNSSIHRWSVRDYLAVGIRASPLEDSDGGEKAALAGTATSASSRRLQVLFPNLEPRLPIVERIYRAIYPVLFPRSSNPLANAKAPIPQLQRTGAAPATVSPSSPPMADPKRMIISGGSAGGYTVLACLTDHPNVFSAATSKYGIADLKALAGESHKFESRYPFQLLGGTPEEVPEVYRDRSPISKVDRIRTPLLVAQGSEDKVVPPNQAEMIVDAIKRQEGGEDRVQYLLFQGEGHGFRQRENVIKMMEEEEAWYRSKLNLGA